jgi:hypothetical protein
MSKHNNVNPDHYKAAGRERRGEKHVGISNRMSGDEEGRNEQ